MIQPETLIQQIVRYPEVRILYECKGFLQIKQPTFRSQFQQTDGASDWDTAICCSFTSV